MNIPSYKYEEAREKIEDGDILIFKNGTTPAALMVKAFLWTPYYHASFAFWLRDPSYNKPRLLTVEQHSGGQRIVNLGAYQTREFEVFKNKFNWSNFGPDLLDSCGTIPYGYLDFLNIGIRERLKVKLSNLKGEVCSEMVMHHLRDQGLKYNTSLVSPSKLRQVIIETGFQLKFSVKG